MASEIVKSCKVRLKRFSLFNCELIESISSEEAVPTKRPKSARKCAPLPLYGSSVRLGLFRFSRLLLKLRIPNCSRLLVSGDAGERSTYGVSDRKLTARESRVHPFACNYITSTFKIKSIKSLAKLHN